MELNELIERLNLEVVNDEYNVDINPGLIQTALRFATEAKLAPLWNRLGIYFAHNADFLSKTYLEAIKPELMVTEDFKCYQIQMALEGFALRWNVPVTLNCFDIKEK
jgi:hypothetical protein